ncbi:MAG TPA: inorganic phosphate transporter [Bryobacteraceae bacterium]|nr:inorganic phosphate transporter [Bryobacteraceae bacterium]
MAAGAAPALQQKMSKSPGMIGMVVFGVALFVGLIYTITSLARDLQVERGTSIFPYLLLGVALLVALGFEFVNGFHDTANAVATVIYTHSMEPHLAVAWSGMWNFIGVLISSGAVAFTIITLLPVELILQVGSGAGFAMVFALLIAAILWNLGTWYFGLPASSSHTMVGSIIGVGIANQLMNPRQGTSGVDWGQAAGVGRSLLVSPLVGFFMAAVLLVICKAIIKDRQLYQAPTTGDPPPFWIRGLLVFTCTGVSFFHGSNDGQKGMGLIMLILIGTVPTTYALNRAVSPAQTADFLAVSQQTVQMLDKHVDASAVVGDPREDLTAYIRTKQFNANTMLALRSLVSDIGNETAIYKQLKNVPSNMTRNFRNDMYVVSESIRLIEKSGTTTFAPDEEKILANYKKHVDLATKFIPTWVKVAVAMALGLGTMIGWKRIVVTVGEKIGKDHLTYGQGAAAEITAMATIGMADYWGLPVSTTHVLSSGVAGTMAANRTGLQWGTVRNLAMAWILTLPAAMLLSGFLFWALRNAFGK